MNLINMAMEDQGSERRAAGNEPIVPESSGPKYPYGLELTLDKDVIEKLGLSDCEVGEVYRIYGEAEVKSVNESNVDDKYDKTLTLQITAMSAEEKPKDGNPVGKDDETMAEGILNKIKDSIVYTYKK